MYPKGENLSSLGLKARSFYTVLVIDGKVGRIRIDCLILGLLSQILWISKPMTQNDSYRRFRTVPYSSGYFRTFPYISVWFQMVPYGSV